MSLALKVIHVFDTNRSAVLRVSLRQGWARALYLHRSQRLLALSLFSMMGLLTLASALPLWLLAVGPVLYGLPHLVSSFRYFNHATGRRASGVMAGFLALMAAVRVAGTHLQMPLFESNRAELLALGTLLLAIPFLFGWNARRWAKTVLWLSPLLLLSWFRPITTVGILILVHNFVGFGYWWSACRTRDDKKVVLITLGLFTFAHWLIFQGFLDPLTQRFTPTGDLPFLGLNVWSLGSQIFPDAGMNFPLWSRAIVAYAFGQSFHYFVWLRAIPEQHLPMETPASFLQSWRFLEADFGKKGRAIAVVGCAILSLGWCLTRFAEARLVYLALASFHGYLEFAGLALWKTRNA